MDSKITPSNQHPMEGSHSVSIELYFELQLWLSSFQTKSKWLSSFQTKTKFSDLSHVFPLPTAMTYKSIIQLISNNWIHILKSKTSQESLLKAFCYNNRGIKKFKNLQKLSKKEIYFTLQNNNKNYNKLFKFIT